MNHGQDLLNKVYIERYRLFRFILVGIVGNLIGLGLIYFLTSIIGIFYSISQIIGFIVGVTHNFIWNKVFTFQDRSGKVLIQYIKYFQVNLTPLAINLVGTFILVEIFHLWYMVGIIICLGIDVLITFTFSRFWIFKNSEREESGIVSHQELSFSEQQVIND
jgi:putative flippase GtrA